MPMSRDELRAQLKAQLGLDDATKSEKAPVTKPTAKVEQKVKRASRDPSPNGNPFKVHTTEPVAVQVEDEDTAVAVEDEPVEQDAEDCGDEPESTPVAELVDKLQDLLDFLADNRVAVRSFLSSLQ